MTLEGASLLAMALGLLCIGQPWVHALFTAGFPLVLLGVVAYNVAGALATRRREEP